MKNRNGLFFMFLACLMRVRETSAAAKDINLGWSGMAVGPLCLTSSPTKRDFSKRKLKSSAHHVSRHEPDADRIARWRTGLCDDSAVFDGRVRARFAGENTCRRYQKQFLSHHFAARDRNRQRFAREKIGDQFLRQASLATESAS